MIGCTRVVWAAALLVVVSTAAAQQCEPGWTEGFPNAPGINDQVRSVVMFDDGHGEKLYITGLFTAAGGTPAAGLARWNGTAWEPVGTGLGAPGQGFWLGVLDDGTGPALYISGRFSSAGGVPASNVARWDGKTWSTFGAGMNDTVRGMTVFDDGTGLALYAVGLFTQAGGVPAKAIARWNGSTWSEVGGGLTLPSGYGSAGAFCVAVFDLGSGPALHVGGVFTRAGDVLANHIASWNGVTWSAIGTEVTGGLSISLPPILTMRLVDDGAGPKLHIGGRFALYPSFSATARVAKWTGASWVQVGPNLGDSSSSDHFVSSLAVVNGPTGPTLYAGGNFQNALGLIQVRNIGRFDGTTWLTLEGSTNSIVRSMVVAEEGGAQVIVAAGLFTLAGTTLASCVARWDGEHWSGFEHNLGLWTGYSFEDICEYDQRVYVCGTEFGTAGNIYNANGIAAWDGSRWHEVGGGLQFSSSGASVFAMTTFDDGTGPALYATGSFISAGGSPIPRLARWNGVNWASVGGVSPNGPGRAFAAFNDGSGPALYLAGTFTQVGSLPANRIARWNGVQWSSVGATNTLTSVYSLAPFDDGTGSSLYAVAYRENPPGSPVRVVLQWDGNVWSELPAPEAAISSNLVVFDDGAGQALFGALANGQGLARWNGSAWQSLAAPNLGGFPVLRALNDGRGPALFFGGSQGGSSTSRLYYLRSGQWHTPGSGVTATVEAIGVGHLNGIPSLYVAGKYISQAGGHPSIQFAEWRGCLPCYPDCDASGALTINDFICFQTRFALGDAYADCDGNGTRNLNDFICFQTKFALGCS